MRPADGLDTRCHYCGCLLTYSAAPLRKSLATREQQRAIFEAASPDAEAVRDQLAAFGHRTVWIISYRCPGCGMLGSHVGTTYSRPEAEAIAAAQNARAQSREAVREAADWRQEVSRRAENDARCFARLFSTRFPEWAPHLRLVMPEGDSAGADERDLEWDCALIARIHSANPRVEAALVVRVLCRQVRVCWGDFWHTHLFAEGTGSADPEHLHRAISEIEALCTETIITCAGYRNGALVSGYITHPGGDPSLPWNVLDPGHPACAHQVVLRSWRGTYDRVLSLSPECLPSSGET
jgi:hypothetical protein